MLTPKRFCTWAPVRPSRWADERILARCASGSSAMSAQERARKISDAQQKLSSQSGQIPTVAEVAQYLELSQEEVLEGLQTAEAFGAVSLDAPVSGEDDEHSTRLDMLGSEDERLMLVDDHATIFAAARCLAANEREVLYLRFGEDLTQSEIAERVGVSQMQVSRLLRRSLARLRELTDAG